jgi:aminopeptidase-like protein
MTIGSEIHSWVTDLFPLCRSITGDGIRESLRYLQRILPEMKIHGVSSGTRVFDWTVPLEWNIKDAFIANEGGERVVDLSQNNLHVVNYSEPIDEWMTFEELDRNLHSLPDQPDAVPYVTSYYRRRWGFCLTHRLRDQLRQEPFRRYHVKIDTTLESGELIYGELILPGSTSREILLSTYLCHPSMANDNLSGPCVQAAVARWLRDFVPDRRMTYRILFLAETIGPLAYLKRHLETLQENLVAGFVLACIGDDRRYSFVASRSGNTTADRVVRHILRHDHPDHDEYSFVDRGSDERQYCSPGVDLPVCTLMRSKFETFPEYHTSKDDLAFVTPSGLEGGYRLVRECLGLIEELGPYRCRTIGEPHLSTRGLYPDFGLRDSWTKVRTMMNLLAYSDGHHDLIDIADLLEIDARELVVVARDLVDHGVLELDLPS